MHIGHNMPLVIGISGASRSGKGTLAKLLATTLGAKNLCPDDFYNHAIVRTLPSTWENSDALDHARCRAALQKLIREGSSRVIIFEGVHGR